MFIEYHKLLRFIPTYLCIYWHILSFDEVYVVSEDSALHLYVRGVWFNHGLESQVETFSFTTLSDPEPTSKAYLLCM